MPPGESKTDFAPERFINQFLKTIRNLFVFLG